MACRTRTTDCAGAACRGVSVNSRGWWRSTASAFYRRLFCCLASYSHSVSGISLHNHSAPPRTRTLRTHITRALSLPAWLARTSSRGAFTAPHPASLPAPNSFLFFTTCWYLRTRTAQYHRGGLTVNVYPRLLRWRATAAAARTALLAHSCACRIAGCCASSIGISSSSGRCVSNIAAATAAAGDIA